MRLSIAPTLLFLAGAVNAASWGFSDGSVTLASKTEKDVTEKFSDNKPAKTALTLGHADTIKVSVTTKEGSRAKRPHQAFLVVKESSGLEAPFPLTVKESGKGTVEITQKDLPVQLLLSQQSLEARLVLGSFGASTGSVTPVFDLDISLDANSPKPTYEAPLRYGKLDEIHHTFGADPKNPPRFVSIVFSLAVLGTFPVLVLAWWLLGGNLDHLEQATDSAFASHSIFFGAIVAMEIVFALYYSAWNLFQTLPVIAGVGVIAFLSGTKALGEVQRRRLAGAR